MPFLVREHFELSPGVHYLTNLPSILSLSGCHTHSLADANRMWTVVSSLYSLDVEDMYRALSTHKRKYTTVKKKT